MSKHNRFNALRTLRSRVTSDDLLLHGAAFLLPTAALVMSFILLKIAPFGGKALLNMDLWGQYFPMYVGFTDSARGASGLLWSWDGGLGFNALAQNAYYFSGLSPLVFLLFPSTLLITVNAALTVVRSALASLFFSFLLRSKFGKRSWAIPGFSAAYGLCAWYIAFITQPMWLDGLVLLPLIILGVERLIKRGSFLPYAAALGLAAISNFYIGYSLCIFTALYFLWRLLSDVTRATVKSAFFTCLRFAGASLLGVGCAAFVLLPVYNAISLTLASGLSAPTDAIWYHSFFDFLKNALFAAKPSLEYGAANIYCGLFTAALLPLYFANGGIPLRRRLTALVLAAFLFVSLNLNLLDYVWHGFHFPNQLPGRWSFMLCFFLLLLAYESFINIKRLRGAAAAVYSALLPAAGIVCILVLNSREKLDTVSLAVSVPLLGVLAALMAAFALSGKAVRRWLIYVLCLLFTLEASVNGLVTISNNLRLTDKSYYDTSMSSLRAVSEKYRARGDEFYRCEAMPGFTFEPGQIGDYYGLSLYSSTMTGATYDFFRNLGFRVYARNVSTVCDGATAVACSVLGLRYIFDRGGDVRSYGATLTDEVEGIDVYENEYALPLGFMASEDALGAVFAPEAHIANQNTLFKALSGLDGDVYTVVEESAAYAENAVITDSMETKYYSREDPERDVTLRFEYVLGDDSPVVLSHLFQAGNIRVSADGEQVAEFAYNIPVRDLGSFAAGTRIEVEVEVSGVGFGLYGARLYALDRELFADGYGRLSAAPLRITKLGGTRVTGTVDAGEGGLLVTSVSNDGGWRVLIDGEPTEALTAFGLMLCARVPAGEHTVELVYSAPGLRAGACVSLACAAVLAAWYVLSRTARKKEKNPPENVQNGL